MKVFLSWSGTESKTIASAFRGWLQLMLQRTTPWMSDEDIQAGDRWMKIVGTELEGTKFGLLFLTPMNLSASWLLFEAGALTKTIDDSRLVPILCGVEYRDITGPLAQFQAKKLDKDGIWDVVRSLNRATEAGLDEPTLDDLFQTLWPKLERDVSASLDSVQIRVNIAEIDAPDAPRSDAEVLEELVQAVRSLPQELELTLERALSELPINPSITDRSKRLLRISQTSGRGVFELYQDNSGAFRFRLKDPAGRIIAVSDSFETREQAREGIRRLQRAVDGNPEVDDGSDESD